MFMEPLAKLDYKAKSPTKFCVELIKQADEILTDLHQRSNSQKSNGRFIKMLPNEFVNAMDYLSIRVKSSKNFKPSKMTRPVLTVYDKVGPGSYNITRPNTPQLIYSNVFISPQKNSLNSRRNCKTPDFIEKNKTLDKSENFVLDHNRKIRDFTEIRKKDKVKKIRKSRIKFMESVNKRVKQELKRNNKEFMRVFMVLFACFSLPCFVSSAISYRKVKII